MENIEWSLVGIGLWLFCTWFVTWWNSDSLKEHNDRLHKLEKHCFPTKTKRK